MNVNILIEALNKRKPIVMTDAYSANELCLVKLTYNGAHTKRHAQEQTYRNKSFN